MCFNKEKQEEALKWLEKEWPKENRKCDICNVEAWNMSPHLTMNPAYAKGYVVGGSVYPKITLICQNCGYVKYINAVIAGIVK